MKIVALMLSLLNVAAVQPSDGEAANALLNHLVGRWTMTGRLGRNQVIHDVDANWVLKREYVQFHEVSRERGAE